MIGSRSCNAKMYDCQTWNRYSFWLLLVTHGYVYLRPVEIVTAGNYAQPLRGGTVHLRNDLQPTAISQGLD